MVFSMAFLLRGRKAATWLAFIFLLMPFILIQVFFITPVAQYLNNLYEFDRSGSDGYANTTIARLNGFSCGGWASIQRIIRSRLLVEIDLGWESLESKEHINNGIAITPATGHSYLRK